MGAARSGRDDDVVDALLTELRDDTARVLKANYPNAAIDVDLAGRRKSPWWRPW